MSQISPKPSSLVSSLSLVRDAQENGALPLGAVQRVSESEGATTYGQTTPSKSVGEQVTLSPIAQLKEMLRQRVADLYTRSETLVRRIVMSGPEQIEALSKELKRLSLELKRLVSQYKALKGMANIESFGAGAQPSSDSLSSLSSLASVSDVSAVSISQVAEPLASNAVDPSLVVEPGTEIEVSNLEKLKQDAIALYEKLSGEVDGSEKDSDRAGESDSDEDGIESVFKEILKKLREARDLLEEKALLAGDQESLKVLEEVKLIESEIVSELSQPEFPSPLS